LRLSWPTHPPQWRSYESYSLRTASNPPARSCSKRVAPRRVRYEPADRVWFAALARLELPGPMRTVIVVVIAELPEGAQVSFTVDEHMVEALAP
jgi:hypothetical protein